MQDNAITITVEGKQVRTLRDILRDEPGLRALFVAKRPAGWIDDHLLDHMGFSDRA